MAYNNFLDDLLEYEGFRPETLNKHLTYKNTSLDDKMIEIISKRGIRVGSKFKLFKEHKLFDAKHILKGYYMKKKDKPTKNLTMEQILDGLHSLYRNGYSTVAIYATLCILLYNYMPIKYFTVEFAMGDFSTEWDCDIILKLQHNYYDTNDIKYLYIVVLITRRNTQAYYKLEDHLYKFYRKHVEYVDITYENNPTILGEMVKLYISNPTRYKKQQQLEVEKGYIRVHYDMFLLRHKDIYTIYKVICETYCKDIYKRDIDIDNLHNMITKGYTDPFEKTMLYIIHWSYIKSNTYHNIVLPLTRLNQK